LVLNKGEIAEFDCAANLLEKKDSLFYNMVMQTGPDASAKLIEKAIEARANPL